MMYGYGYGGGPFMFGGGLGGILWIALIVLAVVFAVQLFRRTGTSPGTKKTALDVLKERYARGEIEKEEFDRKKLELS